MPPPGFEQFLSAAFLSLTDRLTIRELIESWAVSRDALDWDRFRTVWHSDGRMEATWWQGPYPALPGWELDRRRR
jgi:hypothetical protein